jgi:hypothetical protein
MPLPRPVPRETPLPLRVRAKNEVIAKFIVHPRGGRFDKDGVATWPSDSFTHRRVKDGDVTIVEQMKEVKPHHAKAETK